MYYRGYYEGKKILQVQGKAIIYYKLLTKTFYDKKENSLLINVYECQRF